MTSIFDLGKVVTTETVTKRLTRKEIGDLLLKHGLGDFGTCGNYIELQTSLTPEIMSEGVGETDNAGLLNARAIKLRELGGTVDSDYVVNGKHVFIRTYIGYHTTVFSPEED